MLAKLAQKTVEKFVKEDETITPDSVELDSKFLNKKAGTFVTLKKDGELRACIGTYLPTRENIAQEVINNAVGAATRDHRFGAVKKEELSDLSYEVQVLSGPEPITNENDLNPERYGIVVKKIPSGQENMEIDQNVKTSVLLPDLEGIDSAEKQISIACRKAGIVNENQIKVWRFTTKEFTHS